MHAQFRQRGITLMELLTVMVIIGILTAVAVPSYRSYILKTNRTDAKVALTGYAQQLERCYTTGQPQSYNGCLTGMPATTASGNYQITFDMVPDDQHYTLTATAQGTQAQDTPCVSMTLTSAGAQGPSATCW